MKSRKEFVLCGLLVLSLSQTAMIQARPGGRPSSLPIRRIVLYRHGVGYFERQGRVTGNVDIELNFSAGQMSDVLKSLTVIDLGRGTVSTVTFDSSEPLERRLARFSVSPKVDDTLTSLASQLRGVRVEVATSAEPVRGVITGFETRQEIETNEKGSLVLRRKTLVLLMESGELRTFDFDELHSFRILDDHLAQEVKQYFEVLQSSHRRDERTLKIIAHGSGTRQVVAAYTIEVPVWRTTYRIVMSHNSKPLLQGWAIVDNVSDEDWNDVSLSLVSGLPVSFIQDIYSPRYLRRPVVQMAKQLDVTPQTYEAAIPAQAEIGLAEAGTITGTVKDQSGAVVAKAVVTITNLSTGEQHTTRTNELGTFVISGLRSGSYRVEVAYPGFRQFSRAGVKVTPGSAITVNAVLKLGEATEAVTVTAGGGSKGVPSKGRNSLDLPLLARSFRTSATARQVGELFEYRIGHPVTIPRGQSAMVPIVQARIEAVPVSIYRETTSADHPMSGLRLTNSTDLTLEGGNVTVIEKGGYAGETLIETIRPHETRYISYAVDLDVDVSTDRESHRDRAYRLVASRGSLQLYFYGTETKTYTMTNRSDRPRMVVIEHPYRSGWELSDEVEKPIEETPHFYRFQVEIPGRQTTKFVVKEHRTMTERYSVGRITSEQLVKFTAAGYLSSRTRKALEAIIHVKAQMDDLRARMDARFQERKQMFKDEERIRQNLQALGRSDQERQLRARYVEQLNRDEDRLALLQQENQQDKRAYSRLEEQLNEMILKLAVDRTF